MRYVLMDIDGVLNPLGKIDNPYTMFPLPWGGVYIYNDVVAWFTSLTQKPGVTVVWCSMRLEDAHIITRELGLPDLQVIPVGVYKDSAVFDFIENTYTGEETYVWVDDDFSPTGFDFPDALTLVHVDPDCGLTGENMRSIDRLIEE